MVEENWNKLKGFINEEVAPQVYKVYEAGTTAYNEHKAKEAANSDKITKVDD